MVGLVLVNRFGCCEKKSDRQVLAQLVARFNRKFLENLRGPGQGSTRTRVAPASWKSPKPHASHY